MNIIPKHKNDLYACQNLAQASDAEVEKNLMGLLEWVQDFNWPVAPLICERLKDIGIPLVKPVRSILSNDDNIWKYWVIMGLLSKVSNETVFALRSELEDIVKQPTKGEELEEVNIVAKEVLAKCQ